MNKPAGASRIRFLRWLGIGLALLSFGLEVVSKIDEITQHRIQQFNDRLYVATSELSTLGIVNNYLAYFSSGGHEPANQDRPIGLHPIAPPPQLNQGGGFVGFAVLALGALAHTFKMAFAQKGLSLVLSVIALGLASWFIGQGIASDRGRENWLMSSFWWIVAGIPLLATLVMFLLQGFLLLASALFGRFLQVAASPALLSIIAFGLDHAREYVKKKREDAGDRA